MRESYRLNKPFFDTVMMQSDVSLQGAFIAKHKHLNVEELNTALQGFAQRLIHLTKR